MKLGEALDKIKELEDELALAEKRLEDLDAILKVIPQCPAHGPCIPHAMEWLAQVKTMAKIIAEVK